MELVEAFLSELQMKIHTFTREIADEDSYIYKGDCKSRLLPDELG